MGQLPVWYNHPPSAENDYKYLSCQPLYPFGYGLSYTKFEYSGLETPSTVEPGADIEVSVEVKNSGERPGVETVLLYVNDEVSSLTTPVKALKGFQRVALRPGESKKVTFQLPYGELAFLDGNLKEVVEPGKFAVMVGGLTREFEVPEKPGT